MGWYVCVCKLIKLILILASSGRNRSWAELDNNLVPHDLYSGGGKQVSIKHMSGGASRKEESKVAEDESWWL